MNSPLEAVSNVIELHPDKKYLLVFRGLTQSQLSHVTAHIQSLDITCVAISLQEGMELSVIEAPVQET